MKKADYLFVASIMVMSVTMIYAMWIKSLTLFAVAEAGCLLDIIAYWRYNRR